ncbi:MAG: SulP family inorganic anion transporter [Allomuricauda sp.]|jgi:SulP family sulfate permease|uniref:SulP family inorganic anion transporter n=2 Tax=Flavobacteriales TaxID=200644 RepID=UPI0015CC52F7|nr:MULTISPECIES: SulP family inorganic anion transporter [unclassified Allomuricauda]MBO6532006.1 SulP family inorganic anion transporter [Allomuricauda sp.]MBO6587834.1 SulP family inorganic anion transporter [Allomuricauda sp.]MBO6617459.1 SulP family inorganic anion transporter [Allomuricauda sp.]MBO6643530.1 SulP family inorganic anion transporter [Allomuricauda sp.]MBO6745794.1 SulP family inorganic anion transporter [Allomuricauda sp.]
MKKYLNLFDFSQKVNYRTEILSGLTVALALVPEAIAFAFIAGLSPLTGLYAAFVMGLVTSILGGRPGMISGATGAVAVVIVTLAQQYGVEYVFATVILAGILQLLAGVLRLGKLMRLVPHPVIFGFVNGLAVIIFMSQLSQFQTVDGEWLSGSTLYIFLGLVLLTMVVIWGLPKLTKVVPASLAAILLVFGIVFFLGLDTRTIGDIASIQGTFPPFHIPDLPLTWETLQIIFPFAAIMAGVGLIESLLTLNIVDEITETRGRGNKEAVAQGTANILSGFFSGMGGCAMIGQSLINTSNGARARLSGIVAALMLLVFIMFGSSLIERVPMAALTGLMIMVALGTFEWASLKTFRRMPKSDVLVMVLVTLVTVFLHNLALAVLVGVIISALVFAWDNAKRIRARKSIDDEGVKHYEIYGPLFFGSTTLFAEKFDVLNDPDEVVIDFAESRLVDMSAIEAVNKITERYRKVGKKVHLKHLSRDCRRLLANADDIIEVNVLEDPTYKVVVDN